MTSVTIYDKSRLPSRHATVGPDRAPHRSYYYAMGLSAADMARPFVGVQRGMYIGFRSPCSETVYCQIALGTGRYHR